eukprot:1937832-Prymnesium_polylepis.1
MRDRRGGKDTRSNACSRAPPPPPSRTRGGRWWRIQGAAGDHAVTIIDVSGPEEAAPVAAPT